MAGFESSENATDSSLCANNCGFYGNPRNRNLCSKCYTDFLKENSKLMSNSSTAAEDYRKQESEADVVCSKNLFSEFIRIYDQEPNLGTRWSSPSASMNSATAESRGGLNAAAKTKTRCIICKKKVGLLGFNCRCGGLFCGQHRYPEEHSCDVDLKAIEREILAKQNVECKGDKLEFRV